MLQIFYKTSVAASPKTKINFCEGRRRREASDNNNNNEHPSLPRALAKKYERGKKAKSLKLWAAVKAAALYLVTKKKG